MHTPENPEPNCSLQRWSDCVKARFIHTVSPATGGNLPLAVESSAGCPSRAGGDLA